MSNNVLTKSKLKKLDKKIAIEDIDVSDVCIDDLVLYENNYKQFINLKNLLEGISSCQLSDAYNNIYRRSGVVKGLKSINNLKVFGRITAAATNSDDWGTGIIAITQCDEGDVLFIKSSNNDLAIWGELASTDAKNSGVAGVAVYGCVRDMDSLLKLDFPVFACDFTSDAGKPLGLGSINDDFIVDDVSISSGDFFFGDESGVVVIPATLFGPVINEVLSVKLSELNIIEHLSSGKTLFEITGLNNLK